MAELHLGRATRSLPARSRSGGTENREPDEEPKEEGYMKGKDGGWFGSRCSDWLMNPGAESLLKVFTHMAQAYWVCGEILAWFLRMRRGLEWEGNYVWRCVLQELSIRDSSLARVLHVEWLWWRSGLILLSSQIFVRDVWLFPVRPPNRGCLSVRVCVCEQVWIYLTHGVRNVFLHVYMSKNISLLLVVIIITS